MLLVPDGGVDIVRQKFPELPCYPSLYPASFQRQLSRHLLSEAEFLCQLEDPLLMVHFCIVVGLEILKCFVGDRLRYTSSWYAMSGCSRISSSAKAYNRALGTMFFACSSPGNPSKRAVSLSGSTGVGGGLLSLISCRFRPNMTVAGYGGQ